MHYPKVLERIVSPEEIFHRSFSLGASDEEFDNPWLVCDDTEQLSISKSCH